MELVTVEEISRPPGFPAKEYGFGRYLLLSIPIEPVWGIWMLSTGHWFEKLVNGGHPPDLSTHVSELCERIWSGWCTEGSLCLTRIKSVASNYIIYVNYSSVKRYNLNKNIIWQLMLWKVIKVKAWKTSRVCNLKHPEAKWISWTQVLAWNYRFHWYNLTFSTTLDVKIKM